MTDATGAPGEDEGDTEVADEHQRHIHELPNPHFEVIKGNPSHAELAALVTVLSKLSGAATARGARNMWGHPVDKLRYPIFSWQRVTLLERTHMRRP